MFYKLLKGAATKKFDPLISIVHPIICCLATQLYVAVVHSRNGKTTTRDENGRIENQVILQGKFRCWRFRSVVERSG